MEKCRRRWDLVDNPDLKYRRLVSAIQIDIVTF